MHFIDVSVVVAFVIIKVLVGINAGLKINNIREYTYGNNNFLTLTIVIAIFATYVDGESLIYSSAHFYIVGLSGLVFVILLLSNLILITLISPKIFEKYKNFLSMGEMLGYSYGKYSRMFTGFIVVIISITFIAIQIKGVAILFNFFFNTDINFGIWITGLLIVSYSAFGGVRSVTWTDVIKFFTIFFIFPVILISMFNELDLYDIFTKNGDKSTIKFSVLKNNFEYYLALIIPILHPPIVQRIIMSSSKEQAKKSFFIASFFIVLFMIIIGISGFICYIKYSELDPYNAIFYIMDKYSPSGTKGIMICGLLSLIMSSADSYINTSGVTLMNDVIKPIFPKTILYVDDITIAKLSTILIGILSCVILTYFSDITSLMYKINIIWGSTIAVPFIFSLFLEKIHKKTFYICLIINLIFLYLNYIFQILTLEYNIFILAVSVSFFTYLISNFIFNNLTNRRINQ